jgi:peptide/nickel transport system substrate-binding protein
VHVPHNNKYLKKLISVLLLLVMSINIVILGINAESQAITPAYGGTLVVGIPSEPPNLVLTGSPTWTYYQVVTPMCNSLVDFDPQTLEWVPDLAESWQIIKTGDGKMLVVFYLVKNATWHDGVPFTSQDVKFSYEKVGPLFNSFIAGMRRYLEGIDTPDNYTVVFRFNTTWGLILYPGYFGASGTCISPKHLYEGTDIANNPYNTKPIGTGPFKFKEWVKGQYIILERNDKYWKKGLPYLDRIIYKIIPSSEAMMLAFQKGEIDFVWNYGISFAHSVQLENMIREGKLTGKKVWFFPSPGGSLDVLGFNLHEHGPAPLKDVRVRKAIAMAINRAAIAEIVYFGKVEPLETMVSRAPATAMFYPDKKQPDYNPAEANKLLDEAGYKKGPDGYRFRLRLTIDSTSYPWYVKEAELIRDFLREVGIDVQIITLDTAAWHQTVFRNWDFDMSIFPFVHGPGPAFLIQYYTSRGIVRASWSNAMGYNNPKAEQLLLEAEKELNKTRQIELVRQALNIIVDDQPAVWTVSRTFVALLNTAFSDMLQPGVWENGWGTNYMRPEKVFLTTLTIKTTPVETTPTRTPSPPTITPATPTQAATTPLTSPTGPVPVRAAGEVTPIWVYVLVAIIIVILALLLILRVRRK